MPNSLSLNRLVVAAALVLSGIASAQAPANDTCAGALTLSTAGVDVPVAAAAVNISGATSTTEKAFSCQSSTGYSIWYTITPTVTAAYRFETCTTSAPLDTVTDTVIAVYDGTCGGLNELAGGCSDDVCGNRSSVLVMLNAGTQYFIQVAKWQSTAPSAGSDVIQLSAALTSQTPPANDRCSGTVPSLSVNTPVAFTVNSLTGNDSQVGGNLDGGAGTCFSGLGQSTTASANAAPGRDVVFSFTPPANGNYSVRLGFPSNSLNSVLYMTDSCVAASSPPQIYAPPQCIAAANRGDSSTTAAEELVCVPLNSGMPYFIWADETAVSSGGASYELEVTSCTLEAEPNDAPATAGALACPVTGRTNVNGDPDFFSLGTNPAGSRVFALVEAAASGNAGSSSNDYDLRVTTATDTLEYDNSDLDTPFGSSSANIAGTALPGAATFLRVSSNSTSSVREPYRLYSVVQTGTTTAEAEPNDTIATANAGAANYFNGDISSSSDIDLFAFDAQAGSLVFLSLDSQPSRSGSTSTLNHTLQLLNAAGTAVVAVNDSATTVNNTIATGSLTSTTPAVPSEGLVYRIRTTGTYFARVARTSTTAGSSPYRLSISTNGCTTGGGIVTPTVSSITPATGSVSGGTSVTLSGTNFAGAAVVRIGGAVATVTNRSATSITALTPPGADGPVDVTVTNPGGFSATLTGAFTYFTPIAPPTVTSITPTSGPTAGGTVITVNGTLFKAGAEVSLTVGGVSQPATSVVIVNAAQLRATTPAHAPGLATVTVRNPADAMEGSLADAFTYLAPPAITSITPNVGLTTGGQVITIQGTAFRTGATVRFGSTAGTAVVVDPSGTSLTVTTPSSATNAVVDVTIINTDTQQTVLTGGFTYRYPAPTITSVTPNSGAIAGGQLITIAGTGFVTGPTVTVGGTPATSVTRVSATQVTARTPAGTPGLADVTLTNSDAQSVTLTGGYTYQGPPVIANIAPNAGLTTGGLTVTITGSALRTGATVRFGTTLGTNVVVAANELSLTVTSPAVVNNGPVDVTVTNVDGQQSVITGGFTYAWPTPTIAAISPTSGYARGGTAITITGTSFQAGVNVTVGGAPVTGLARSGTTQITAVTPAGTPGLANVVVTNTDSQTVTLANGFRYVAPPSIVSVSPSHGPMQGGTPITISGMDFQPGTVTVVRLGGVPAFAAAVTSTMTITAVTNANMMSGPVDVEIINPDLQAATLTDGFTYDPSPELTSLSPLSGSTAGGTVVTLTGSGFLTGATVLFGSVAATNVTVVSATELTAVTAAEPAGVVSVTVRNQDNQSTELPRAFRFVAPPTVTAATPSTGDVLGGTLVHITGTGFTAGTTVTFGTSTAALVSIVSATELDAVTPRHQPGVVDIKVATDGAEAILTDGFTYTRSAPTLTAVAPVSGPIAGGTLLTLNGTGFAPGATITVGGAAATDVVIVSDVLARAVVPAHAAGTVDVVFTNDDNQTTTLAGGFTYVAPPMNNAGTVTDGGTGSLGEEPPVQEPGGGVSCGCSSFDGSMFSMAGFGLLMVLSRRRRRS